MLPQHEYSWGDRCLPSKLRRPPAAKRPRIDATRVPRHRKRDDSGSEPPQNETEGKHPASRVDVQCGTFHVKRIVHEATSQEDPITSEKKRAPVE